MDRDYVFPISESATSSLRVLNRTAGCCGIRTIFNFPEVPYGLTAQYLAQPDHLKNLLKKIIDREQQRTPHRDGGLDDPDLSEEFIALAFNLTDKQIKMLGGDRILADFEEIGFKPAYSWVNSNTQNQITHFVWLGE